MARQKLVERRLDGGVVGGGRAAGVVVQDVEPAEMAGRGLDGARDAVGIGDIGRDRDRAIAGEMRALLARRRIDLGDRDAGALAGEQDRGGAADPGARAGDQRHLAFEPIH
jgi:hypothetical protein